MPAGLEVGLFLLKSALTLWPSLSGEAPLLVARWDRKTLDFEMLDEKLLTDRAPSVLIAIADRTHNGDRHPPEERYEYELRSGALPARSLTRAIRRRLAIVETAARFRAIASADKERTNKLRCLQRECFVHRVHRGGTGPRLQGFRSVRDRTFPINVPRATA